jgi:Alternative complex III, ActD subunit
LAEREQLYALLAEFETPEELIEAVRQARAAGYARLEAYSPFPVEGLADALGRRERALPFIALAGGVVGGIGTYALQWYLNAVNFPINIGGRPLNAWPAFAVPAYEVAILGIFLAVFFGLLVLNRLPRLHHPIFNAARFRRVTVDRFFLAVRSEEGGFDPEATRALLERLGARAVEEVPR